MEMIKMALNFDFLQYSNPKLYEYGSKMEVNMFSDRDASAQYGSDFLNEFIKEIYGKEGLTYIPKSFMTKNIDDLAKEGIITPQVKANLEKAKLLRDYIMERNGSRDRILALRSTLVDLAAWFFDKYEKGQNN